MIKREAYMSRIRPFIGNELIKVLTGIRRSGKSVMLELIQHELTAQGVDPSQFVKLNFEDMNNARFCTAEALHKEVTERVSAIGGKAYLFFDEIQEVEEWEKCINSFRVEFDCDIYITGSNAKLLSGELATYLAGRYVEFIVYPFSFEEFMELYSNTFGDTQKPEALLERIIQCASQEGDIVLDPFMGGGTTIAVADKLRRQKEQKKRLVKLGMDEKVVAKMPVHKARALVQKPAKVKKAVAKAKAK